MGGDPQTTTTTVDPKYNKGLLKISEEQQKWAGEMFNMFKYGVDYDPNETVSGEGSSKKVWVPERRGPRIPEYNWDSGELEGYKAGKLIPGHFKTVKGEGPTTTRGELEGYDPDAQISEMQFLQSVVEANAGLLTDQTAAERANLGLMKTKAEAEEGLIPFSTEAAKTGLQYQTGLNTARSGLLPGQADLAKKGLDFQSSFLDEASRGVDKKGWMDEAQAGVQHGYKLANQALRKDISSYGLDPGAGRYASQNREMRMNEAAGVGGARTAAGRSADVEDYRRKESANANFKVPTI